MEVMVAVQSGTLLHALLTDLRSSPPTDIHGQRITCAKRRKIKRKKEETTLEERQ
jgi:hypothetical protein